MSGFAKVVKKIYVILNILSTILAVNNTHILNTRFERSYPKVQREYPTKIINHSQIDFD